MSAVLRWRSRMSEDEGRPVLEHTQHDSGPGVFERGSPVHAYWLERCTGFAVVDARGREIGRVRRADRERNELIVIRRVRKRRVSMAAVQSVSPRDTIIHVPELSRCTGPAVTPVAAVGEETLPWFDLIGGEAASDERRNPLLGWIRQRPLTFLHTIDARTRKATRSGLVEASRIATALRHRTTKLAYELRGRCARGLIRLAHAVEPRSQENR